MGKPAGSGVILFISFGFSLKRKERGKWSSYRMLLLQVDVRVRGSFSGSLALISSRDTVVGQMSTTKALFPRFALSLVEAETGRRRETAHPQVFQS